MQFFFLFADAMEAVKQGGAAVGCKVTREFRKTVAVFLFLSAFQPLLQNNEYVVLATLKRAASELSSSQRKLFKIDDNVGIAISGLTADGTAATKALRSDCISHKFTYESQVDIGRLAARVADKSQASNPLSCRKYFTEPPLTSLTLASMMQISTQRSGARPSGVGMLIAGIDEQGCHLYQTCPSGNLYNHIAAAIGKTQYDSESHFLLNINVYTMVKKQI